VSVCSQSIAHRVLSNGPEIDLSYSIVFSIAAEGHEQIGARAGTLTGRDELLKIAAVAISATAAGIPEASLTAFAHDHHGGQVLSHHDPGDRLS
jgi:hypothetical protein